MNGIEIEMNGKSMPPGTWVRFIMFEEILYFVVAAKIIR